MAHTSVLTKWRPRATLSLFLIASMSIANPALSQDNVGSSAASQTAASLLAAVEPSLDLDDLRRLTTGAATQFKQTFVQPDPDTRVQNFNNLPGGPFPLRGARLPYDSYTGDTIHRQFEMWQQSAFDLLTSDGKDLRTERLLDRKQELRRLLAKTSPPFPLRYAEHVEGSGTALFHRVCKMDLEGIVAKHSFGTYVTEPERTSANSATTAM